MNVREFDVIVRDAENKPVGGVAVKVGGESYVTDATGKTTFDITFNEANYNLPASLEVWKGERIIIRQEVDFFTETPIIVTIKS
jgi:hypothetical protein